MVFVAWESRELNLKMVINICCNFIIDNFDPRSAHNDLLAQPQRPYIFHANTFICFISDFELSSQKA